MRSYIVRRLLLVPVTLLLISILIFVILRVLPGDVAHAILGQGGQATYTVEEYEDLRESLGLAEPLPSQYWSWLSGAIRLDFGESLYYGTPVATQIWPRFVLTLEIAVIAWVVAMALGLTAGAVMAMRQGGWLDNVLQAVSNIALTAPAYWIGALLLVALVVGFQWSPPIGFVQIWESPLANVQQLVFPALAASLRLSGLIARMTRTSLLEVLRQDYMQTAWSKGLPVRLGIRRHALKNALIPVITVAGYQFGFLLAGVMVLELIFTIPGLGRAFFEGLRLRDYPLVQALVLLTGFVFIVTNLVVDLLYAWLDPRIRYKGAT